MADPISAAIAAFSAAAASVTAAATTALVSAGLSTAVATAVVSAGTQFAITAAATATMSALSPKPKINATASQLQTKVGAVTPRAIIMGRTAVAGTLLTPTPLKSGKDDRFASNFYALSHAGPSGLVESIQWGDDTVTFDGSGNAIGKYNDNMWLFQKNGDWNQTAISYAGHPVLGSSTPSAWDSTKRARGCLVVALVVRYAAKVLGGNMQTPLFVVDANAVALTDPRTGSAATTQAQRRNPAVWAYSWRLGWFQNSKRVIGMGQASGELHAAGYAYAANVADANGWTISGEATTADDRYAVESAILLAAASVPVERNGLQSVVTSALRSSVGTITSDDLRANPKWRYNTQQSSRPTAIQTRYRSESNRWQMVEGAEVTDASWLTQDAGREKRITVEYPYAAGGSAHVGHLAALDASNAREPLIFSLPCKQRARYAGFVGDAVTVSLPEIGLSSTKMTVQNRIINPDGTVDYDLLVETDAKYAFAAGKTSAAPSFTLQPGFDIFSVPQPLVGEWSSAAVTLSEGTTTLPAVRVTGSAADYTFCTGLVFKLRLNTSGAPWLVSDEAPPSATQHEFRGLTPDTSYVAGVSYRGATGVEGPVRELGAVTTGVLIVGTVASVDFAGVTGSTKPENNATVGGRVGVNIFPSSGSTPLPGTQLLNDQIGIDANGRLTNTGTGSAVVGNAQITVDANGRLTTTGTGSVVVDNSKITLGTLGFTGATDATRNGVSTGLLAARPTGSDGDLFFATDDNNGAGLLYTKIAGAWVADPKAKVLFDNLTTTVNANEAINSSFRSSQTTNNSAQAASLTTLEAQMANTSGSGLQSRISTEESARASADSALATRATTLEAQMANTSGSGLQSRIATEESTRASADSAQASQITTLSATVNANPNLFPYPTPINNRTPTQLGWTGTPITSVYSSGVGGLVYYRARASGGSALNEGYQFDLPETMAFSTGQQFTFSCYGYAGSATVGDRVYAFLEFRSADNSTSLYISPAMTLNSGGTRQAVTGTFPGSPTNGRLRVIFIREWPSSGSYQDVVFNMIKVECGPVATAFTNSAQVIVSANAIATLNDSAAFWQVLVAASGGDPAIVRLFSGLGGSEISLAAKVLSLINTSSGVAMPVMRATGGEAFFQRPISSDFGTRRVTIGPGYGVFGSEVVLWFGPSTIAPANQSRTNCIFALGTDGIVYYGGTNLEVGGMQGTLNLYNVNLTRSGAGSTVQSMTATGFAPGTISYLWELVSGDAVNIGSTTAATTNIGHSLSVGQTKTSVVKCTMTSSAGPSTFRLLNISSSEIS
jgi:hypothetical protein